MSRVRFLDQVPVGAFTVEGNVASITASYAISALSASYASSSTSASYALNSTSASYTLTASYTPNYTLTSSFNNFTGSYNTGSFTGSFIGQLTGTSSYSLQTLSSSYSNNSTSSSYSITASYYGGSVISASYSVSSSQAQNSISSSLAQNALTASYVLNAISASYYGGSVISSSYSLSSSFAVTAQTASYVQTAQTASYVLNAISSSLSQTASYVLQAVSASFASTASLAPLYVLNTSTGSFITNSQTSSFVLNSQTSSMTVATASYVLQAVSASFATSASKYNEIDPIFVSKSASLATTGSNTFIGNQTISGSLFLSGSATDSISIILPASGAITSSTQSGSYSLIANSSSGFSFYAPTALNASIYALTISGGLAIRNSNLNNLGYIYNPASVNALGVYTAAGLTQYSWMGSGIVSSFSYTTANQNIVGTTGIFAQGVLIASGSTTLHGATVLNNSFARASSHIISTGTTFTISGSVATVYTDPTASISSFTYTLPATSSINNGHELLFLFGGNLSGSSNVITTLTISASAGTAIIGNLPTSANVTSSYSFKYRSDNAKWYRLY
jgi:hypothetical protein